MKTGFKKTIAAATMGLGLMLCAPAAQAQIAAYLPHKDSVAQGPATDVDGTYTVSTIGKRITIENGRAYVVDGWMHAFILEVKPDMVTLRNFRETGPDEYTAEDLPMMGTVVFRREGDGSLAGTVRGPLGQHNYRLIPTEPAGGHDPIDDPIEDPDDLPPEEDPDGYDPGTDYDDID